MSDRSGALIFRSVGCAGHKNLDCIRHIGFCFFLSVSWRRCRVFRTPDEHSWLIELKRLEEIGIEMPENLFAARQLTPDMAVGPLGYSEPSAPTWEGSR